MTQFADRVALGAREGWGMSVNALCHVIKVREASDVSEALRFAKFKGWSVAHWGGGRSYGDAALNEGQLLLDFSSMNAITDWDPETGRVVCEPGVTLEMLWTRILPDGWWPAVVSGTMFTTVGGLCAANAHGKNNFKHGPFSEYVLSFDFVTADGELQTVTSDSNPELFHAALGGFGWLGTFTSITLQTKKVHSGRVAVSALCADGLSEMFQIFQRCEESDYDYVVGWVDAYATGGATGRGQVHAARYPTPGEDVAGQFLITPADQTLPARFMGVLPFAWLHYFARPFANRWGMRLINWARFHLVKWKSAELQVHYEPHVRFNFLLDFVPKWHWFTKPGGLIQFQLFIPKDRAEDVFCRAIEAAQLVRTEPYLVVMKRHRTDAFWLSHAVDGYSLAMDFFVTDANRETLYQLTQRFSELGLAAGGRFYFAKDSVLTGKTVRASLGDELIGRFMALKSQVDPTALFQSNQYRRFFAQESAPIGSSEAPAAESPVVEDEPLLGQGPSPTTFEE